MCIGASRSFCSSVPALDVLRWAAERSGTKQAMFCPPDCTQGVCLFLKPVQFGLNPGGTQAETVTLFALTPFEDQGPSATPAGLCGPRMAAGAPSVRPQHLTTAAHRDSCTGTALELKRGPQKNGFYQQLIEHRRVHIPPWTLDPAGQRTQNSDRCSRFVCASRRQWESLGRRRFESSKASSQEGKKKNLWHESKKEVEHAGERDLSRLKEVKNQTF